MTQTDEARRLFDEGLAAYRAGEYEEALEGLAQARELFVEAGNPTGVAEVLGSQGVIYVQLEEWESAEQALNEALAICIESQDRFNQGLALGNLGTMYERQGDEAKAIEAYEQSITIFQELGERDNEKAVARRLSKLKLKKGKFLESVTIEKDWRTKQRRMPCKRWLIDCSAFSGDWRGASGGRRYGRGGCR